MVALKKYDFSGKEVGNVEIDDAFVDVHAHRQMVKDVIVALRANARQWSANTKGRSEVSHSTQKPHRQKGTGKARQGSLAAPQYKGGGVVFGPKPKFDQHVRMNRKERRTVLQFLLAEKVKSGSLIVLDDKALKEALSIPRTKNFASLLQTLELKGRRTLFIGPQGEDSQGEIEALVRSVRNIPRTTCSSLHNLNSYQVLLHRYLVFSEASLKQLIQSFGESNERSL